MAVELSSTALAHFSRFSQYNSPYAAHRAGRAIDLYPSGSEPLRDRPSEADGNQWVPGCPDVPSPVAGTVLATRSVTTPSRPYAAVRDHLLLVDVGSRVARILHVEPSVEPGERIGVGDPLGRFVRSGYFAPWVGPHVHLEFRPPAADPLRARGSVRIEPAVAVEGVGWDGNGTVVGVGETYVVLDAPSHPAPGERYAALATDDGQPLDGGLVHYAVGGRLGADGAMAQQQPTAGAHAADRISLLGAPVGRAGGREIEWGDVEVRANGERVTGLSLSAARDTLGTKVVWPTHQLSVGDEVVVTVADPEPTTST